MSNICDLCKKYISVDDDSDDISFVECMGSSTERKCTLLICKNCILNHPITSTWFIDDEDNTFYCLNCKHFNDCDILQGSISMNADITNMEIDNIN